MSGFYCFFLLAVGGYTEKQNYKLATNFNLLFLLVFYLYFCHLKLYFPISFLTRSVY